jgi:ferric-dicitrate binding protein FerR (iron transport regulator)
MRVFLRGGLFHFLLFSSALLSFSQPPTLDSIYTSLDELERTLLDMQSDNESLKADTQALRENLTESEAATARLSALSEELRSLSNEQAEAYSRQSALLEQSERKSRRWRLASIIEGAALVLLVGGYVLFN